MRLMPRPVWVISLDRHGYALPITHCEKESAGRPDVLTVPARFDLLISGGLKDRAQVRACRNLLGLQRLPVLVPYHEPSRLR